MFDASSVTGSGYSLNDLLAKGINSLNSMLEIFMRFRCWEVALHTDVRKLYNHVNLKDAHWRFHLYFWERELNVTKDPKEKVVKTIIYGVRSSGNQAECALRKCAELQKDKYPKAADAVIEDTYMDDTATGTTSIEKVDILASDIDQLLARGGFSVKGFTISGRPPLQSLSKDGVSVSVLGNKWYSEADQIQLQVGLLNFSKKRRGKKSDDEDSWVVPKKLTKRICMGKVAEVFDLTGLVCPIMSGLKLDLHDLHMFPYDWDDQISDVDREKWLKNFKLIEELGGVLWSRVVIPNDAVSRDVDLIGAGDASQGMACSACYIRFKRKDCSYSCQLLLAKSKIVSKGTSLPRAELLAATLNTHTTEIVKRALKKENVVNTIYVLDSEISLHWIASQTKPLKPWVRNRVIEITRFTDITQWFHVNSNLNPVDLATRKGARISDIDQNSDWINGKSWMSLSLEE